MSQAGPFSPIEFDFLWESLGIGEVPYPLRLRSHGATVNERVQLRRQTLADLARRGIVDGRGQVEPRLAEGFEVLTAATRSVDAVHLVERGRPLIGALVGAIDGQGSLLVQDERGVRMHQVPADALASTIVSLLPPAPRGKERSITIPAEELVTGAGADFMRRSPGPGANGSISDDDRKALARLHAEPRSRGGQIGANVRSEAGTKSRAPALSWFDADSGRYLTQASEGADGREWITIAPADAAGLRHRIGEMLLSAERASNTW